MPKPKSKKKPFIDTKREKTTTFALIHRSQRDPLAADSDAPQRLLHPLPSKSELKRRKEEEQKFGIFYDDDYDYLKHLKSRDQVQHDWDQADAFLNSSKHEKSEADQEVGNDGEGRSNIKLPDVVFASELPEAEVGLLNLAAPRPGPRIDWDPDIVETLDDAFEHTVVYTLDDEEENESDGVELDEILAEANEESSECEGEGESDYDTDYASEADDRVPSLENFSDEETRSKFTAYSMSSSVMRRNEQLSLLDDRFEKFFDGYDEENVGSLDMDLVEGFRTESSDVMASIVDEFEAQRRLDRQQLDRSDLDKRVVGSEDDSSDHELVELDDEKPDRFDCESILSTYSTLYNHPKLIKEPSIKPIRVCGRTGIPKNVLGKGLTAGALKMLDEMNGEDFSSDDEPSGDEMTLASRVSRLSFRNKHESKDEKKARKVAVKELRRERRMEKKANTAAFKEEKARQEKAVKIGRQQRIV